MAAGTLPKIGTELGPCEGGCAHADCNETRRLAAAKCDICGNPIGYNRPFYGILGDRITHADCEEKSHEQTTQKQR